MKARIFLLFSGIVFSFLFAPGANAAPIRVACVGDSVTYGLHIINREENAYPSQLQSLLGNGYRVDNYGRSGTTLLRKGHNPYFLTDAFQAAISSKPDIVIIHLGLNDTDPRDWPNYRDAFRADYSWLIEQFRQAKPDVQIYISILTPIFESHPRFKSGTRVWAQQIRDEIPQIAQANRVGVIDLYTPLLAHPNLFPDALHPNAEGASILAHTVYRAISGDNGGLQLPEGYGDHMILPYGEPVRLAGTANRNDVVDIEVGSWRMKATADQDGQWNTTLPAQKPGGPFTLRFITKGKQLQLQDVYFGELWLCSGQSNMEFPVSKSAEADRALKIDSQPLIRLLHYNNAASTDASVWNQEALDKVNQLHFFSGEWQTLTQDSVSNFSAVGYFFALNLYQKLRVPIGIVQLTVGGSNAESWIDRRILQDDPQLADMLVNWRNSDFIMAWCRERADLNLANAHDSLQRHPFEPAYNYEAGIAPLKDLPFRGVIWYQGESNTENIELYERLFPAQVESWRKLWGRELPFLFVQISDMNRPSWPRFRDAQRRLEDVVPNSGMVVSSDLGEPEQVHFVHKRFVGERLSELALEKVYHVADAHGRSPEGFKVSRGGAQLKIEFRYSYGQLKTSDNQDVRGFELRDIQGKWHAVSAHIAGGDVQMENPGLDNIDAVAYSWQPYSDANLVNSYGLPASTFILNIPKEMHLLNPA